MVTLESVPAELTRPGRALPPWAPSIGYLITLTLLTTLFIGGPGIAAIALGALADVPGKVKAITIASGVVIVMLVPIFVGFAIRRRRVYRNGPLAAATIEKRTDKRIKQILHHRYDYTFATPSGPVKGHSMLDALATNRLGFVPDRGDTVFIAYDSMKPKRNYAWWFARDGAPTRVPGAR
ncbi:MAG TPA: hypothetical protein VL326_21510 [Kofleriaceae bacterium]|nr:hypothetical protein [Kofleriaceae bacterium]